MSKEQSIRNELFQDYPDMLSVDQLCEMLDISERTAYRFLDSNTIRHFRIGRKYRIPKVFVFDFIEAQMQEPTA